MRTLIVLISLVLLSCSPTKSDEQKNIDLKTVFGNYKYRHGHHGITLNSDSTYKYSWGYCTESGRDSGKYTVKADTIYFTSLLKQNNDSVKVLANDTIAWLSEHGQITPITGDKYLLKNGRIYYSLENGIYNKFRYWLHESLKETPYEKDTIGDGHFTLYNKWRQISKEGLFSRWTLVDGLKYNYDDNGELIKIEIFKNKVKVRDSSFTRKPTSET